MKKRILLLSLSAGMIYVATTSSSGGATTNISAGNRTGARGSNPSCATTGGCHSGTTGTPTSIIRVDSAGVRVNQYTAGKTYTIHVVGKHATKTKFGFQFAAVSGTGSTQTQAGTFSGLPGSVANRVNSTLNIIEQSSTITAVSPADSFEKSFTWVAPATGVGTITMYLTVNAVNGDGNDNAADGSSNTNITLPLYTPPTSAVDDVANSLTVNAFPNPAAGVLNIQVGNEYKNFQVVVTDIAGRNVYHANFENNVSGTTSINTSDWTPGLYNVNVISENAAKAIRVVKQ